MRRLPPLKPPIWDTIIIMHTLVLFGSLCLLSFAHAEESAINAQIAAKEKPVVSELGRRRIRENLKILSASVKDISDNITASQHNVATIEKELAELQLLEREHLSLKKKYHEYLRFAQAELNKNEKSTKDLAAWEKRQLAATEKLEKKERVSAEAAMRERLSEARRERVDRDLWRADAVDKIQRVKGLLAGIDRNLLKIRTLRAPLKEQLDSWKAREAAYQNQLREAQQKKADLESFVFSK